MQQQPVQNINQQKLISMSLTLPHSTILVQCLEKLITNGLEGMALVPGAKEGDPNYMPPSMVAAHLAEIATGLHRTIMETVQNIQKAQQMQQAQAAMGVNQNGMFGTAQMPMGDQVQPQEPMTGGQVPNLPPMTPEMNNMLQGMTDLNAQGVNQVPLSQGPAGQPPNAPTLMPQPSASQNQNESAIGSNGAAGSPMIVDPNRK